MPKIFNKVLEFKVEGEIYDTHDTTPESIIKNYNWSFKEEDNNIIITGHHKDHRGRITKMTKLSKIKNWKKPDTGFFLKM